ncbi:MAG: YhgE/Pip domain-containing protein [Lachnospiraceae bacterium]|nr:YhgE/Pip domain-containing protein [Lachnospiraceae bacterium]
MVMINAFKQIFAIFKSDVKGISKNFFALTIAIGLCLIPPLYAWFNIYSNWDPYANTGAVKIAVFSEDKGYTLDDGSTENMGDSVIENLKENKKLGWTFTDSSEEAIKGVESGDFYAAIIIGDNFSSSMLDFIENDMERPSVTYYENAKKNAVASKITQTGMSSLQEEINSQFIATAVTSILETSSLKGVLTEKAIPDALSKLQSLQSNLNSYHNTISAFIESDKRLTDSINTTNSLIASLQEKYSSDVLNESRQSAKTSIADYIAKFTEALNGLVALNNQTIDKVNNVSDLIDRYQAGDPDVSKEDILDALNDLINVSNASSTQADALKDELNSLLNGSEYADLGLSGQALDDAQKTISDSLANAKDYLVNSPDTDAALVYLEALLDVVSSNLNEINNVYNENFATAVSNVDTLITTSIDYVYDSLITASSDLSYVSRALTTTSNSLGNINSVMTSMDELVTDVSAKVGNYIDALNSFMVGAGYEALSNLLGSNPSEFGDFFSSPVNIKTVSVYDELNYGSAVAPFYTTLAIWVGGLILTAILKTSPEDKKEFADAPLFVQYFGRYALFFVMGQAQAIITVVGNLIVFKTMCAHPGMLIFTASLTSLTFSLLIYTLTLAFGDVGKALAVVIVVIQIAGSSGTFPIELLPNFFQQVYIYFPFPYAINAMRECISGFYGADYLIYILKLLIFVGISLFLGLVIRKPFMNLKEYMHSRMHDTGMM